MGIVKITGTISVIYPPEMDPITGKFIQNVILDNVSSSNTVEQVDSRLLLQVWDASQFKMNDPITVKGSYRQQPTGYLSILHDAHAPLGFIQHKGVLYNAGIPP
jgi:hypothetical protein